MLYEVITGVMNTNFIGLYLVRNGVISRAQLEHLPLSGKAGRCDRVDGLQLAIVADHDQAEIV